MSSGNDSFSKTLLFVESHQIVAYQLLAGWLWCELKNINPYNNRWFILMMIFLLEFSRIMVYYLQLKWRISIHFRNLKIVKSQVSFWGGTEVCPGGWKHIFDTIAILNRIAIIADFKIVILRNRISSQVRIFILMTSNDLSFVLIFCYGKIESLKYGPF